MASDRAHIWTRGRINDRCRTAQQIAAAIEARVWQIEAGEISGRVYLNAAPSIGLKEHLNVIVYTNVEAKRDIGNVDVSWITIVIAIGNTKSEFPSTYRRAVVDREKPSRPTHRTTCPYCRRLIARITLRPSSLSRCCGTQHQRNERSSKRPSCESHRIPPAK